MLILPKIRNNICINAHPLGCALETLQQIQRIKEKKVTYSKLKGPACVLVIGASTGYGLASRIAAAFGFGSATIGVSYEKEGSINATGTPGWYNNKCFEQQAAMINLPSVSINGDAFSDEVRTQTIQAINNISKPVDLVIYSLASPVRNDPKTGQQYRSVIKPIGRPFHGVTLDPFTKTLGFSQVSPASDADILSTVKVMGGEDWTLWIKALAGAGVLAPNAITVSYSYVGPRLSFPIYREGTIGRAKADLETRATFLPQIAGGGLRAYVSVNKALVTRSSSVIPIIPLYISILYKVMKERGLHEDCLSQIDRLYTERLYSGTPPPTDAKGRIRLDELEMGVAVQSEVESRLMKITKSNLDKLADVDGFRIDFLRLHGFDVGGIDYNIELDGLGNSLITSPDKKHKAETHKHPKLPLSKLQEKDCNFSKP